MYDVTNRMTFEEIGEWFELATFEANPT